MSLGQLEEGEIVSSVVKDNGDGTLVYETVRSRVITEDEAQGYQDYLLNKKQSILAYDPAPLAAEIDVQLGNIVVKAAPVLGGGGQPVQIV